MNFRIGTRLWSGLLVLLVLFWALGLFAVKQYPGLPTPPELTLWGLPALRYARDIGSMLTIGTLVVGAFLVLGHSPRVLRWALGWVAIWFTSLIALTTFTLCDIEAITLQQALNPQAWWPFLTGSFVGRVFAFQLVAVVLLWVLLTVLNRRITRGISWVALVLGLAAIIAPAFLGHGGFTNEHVAMTISLGIHIAAVSLWVGGLAACVAVLVVDRSLVNSLMTRFSLMALWCVIILAETGLLNASLRIGSASSFVGTTYGSLILVKAALLAWLIWFGWQQRSKVIPVLAEPARASISVVKYAGLEFLLMAAAIAVSITLSRIGFEISTTSSGSFTPMAILVIALAAPILINVVKPKKLPKSKNSFMRNYPELASVVHLVVVIEVCGIGLTESIFGVQLGVIFGSLALLAAGWFWSISIDGPRKRTGVVMMMLGFPFALLLSDVIAQNSTDWKILALTLVIAEALVGSFLFSKPVEVNPDSDRLESTHA